MSYPPTTVAHPINCTLTYNGVVSNMSTSVATLKLKPLIVLRAIPLYMTRHVTIVASPKINTPVALLCKVPQLVTFKTTDNFCKPALPCVKINTTTFKNFPP